MTLTQLYEFLHDWIDSIINVKTDIPGNCTFTYNGTNVTGTNFITSGLIAGYYIKLKDDDSSCFAKIKTVVSETLIVLETGYLGSSDTDTGVYTTDYIQVIYSRENAPRPKLKYICINQPPVSNNDVGYGNQSYSDDEGNVDYTKRYQAAISIEEVGGKGDYLQKIINSTIRQDVIDYFYENEVSFLRNESILDISDLIENIHEIRSIVDIYLLYPQIETYQPGYIEDIDYTGNFTGG